MSVERALKSDLERVASAIAPDEAGALESVLRRHRTRQRTRRIAYAFAGAAVVTAAVLGGPRALDALLNDARPAPPVERPQPNAFLLSGTYTTSISDRPGLLRSYSLAGRWTLRIAPSGSARLDAPAAYTAEFGVPAEGVFSVEGERLFTYLLHHPGLGCEEQGIYEWSVAGRSLRFTTIEDSCRMRSLVLTSVWTRST